MPTLNHLHIDSVYIEYPASSLITNVLDGATNIHASIDTTSGYKFIVELVNSSGSTINFATTNVTLRFRTNYRFTTDGEADLGGTVYTDFTITSGTLDNSARHLIGWDGIVSGITMDTATTSIYLSEQDYSSVSVHLLYDTGVGNEIQDMLVDNGADAGETLISEIFENTSNASGIVYRNRTGTYTAPESSFDGFDNWLFTTSDITSILLGPNINNHGGKYTNLYIDAVYIDTDGGSAYSSITNQLHGEDVHSSVSTITGYKWIVQLVNGGFFTIDMSNTHIQLQICTNYVNDEGIANSQLDFNINITSGTILVGESHYIGWNIVSNITPDTLNESYIATQKNDSSQIVAAPRLRLFLDGTSIDVAGSNTKDAGGEYYSSSMVDLIFDSTSNGDGLARRKPTIDAPNTTFTSSDWTVVSSDFYTYLVATAEGDPHIKTLTGENYEFDYLGAFRLFEDTIQGHKIIINGLSEKGPGRWKEKQYIQQLFIQYNDKHILVDMGFRGRPVTVLENNGIEYDEKLLDFNAEAKRYRFSDTYRTLDLDEPVSDDLPALIRNEISILLNNDNTLTNILSITLQNVNQYNLQPCRFTLNLSKVTELSKGCIVDRKYVSVSKLSTITDTHELVEPSLEELEDMPELEIAPILRNIQWQ